MRRSIIVVLCLLVLLSGCTIIIGTFGDGDLDGYVYDKGSSSDIYFPLSEAKVYVSSVGSTATTNSRGHFLINDLPEGYNKVTINHDNWSKPARYRVWIDADRVNEYEFFPVEEVTGKGHYIFIGIDNYQYHDDELMPANSTVSVKDAYAMRDIFADVRIGTSQTLINQQATYNLISSAIRYASNQANQDDYLVLYFSGYADGELRGGSRSLDHIVPYDGKSYGNVEDQNVITDMQLREWLERFPNSNVTVIIDASYSGSFVDGTATTLSIEPLALKDTGYTVMASAQVTEKINIQPNVNSAFTKYILEGLTDMAANENPSSDDVITAYELHHYVSRKLDQAYYQSSSFTRQSPVLEPKDATTPILRQ